MEPHPDAESGRQPLWLEYGAAFAHYDDLSMARWLCQTLGQLEGRVWRMSHPLVSTYKLCAEHANKRQLWLKNLATPPVAYIKSSCCRSPLLPLLTRDVRDSGLICTHCGETAVELDDIPDPAAERIRRWAKQYADWHAVAHWENVDLKSKRYADEMEHAAKEAESLLLQMATKLAPMLLEFYPAVIWEDQDECLDICPEDLRLT